MAQDNFSSSVAQRCQKVGHPCRQWAVCPRLIPWTGFQGPLSLTSQWAEAAQPRLSYCFFSVSPPLFYCPSANKPTLIVTWTRAVKSFLHKVKTHTRQPALGRIAQCHPSGNTSRWQRFRMKPLLLIFDTQSRKHTYTKKLTHRGSENTTASITR